MDLEIKKWTGDDILTCAEKLSALPYTLFFDSNRPEHPESQWSFLCWNPIETITAKNAIITHNNKIIKETDIFGFLQSRLDSYKLKTKSDIPFTGGIAGYWGYDLGRQLENLPNNTLDDMNVPDMMLGIYTNVMAHNHKDNQTWLISPSPNPIPVGERAMKLSEAQRNLTAMSEEVDLKWKTKKTKNKYKSDIQHAIDYIYAGDIYQVNLSRRFERDLPPNFDPFIHYKKLREINPAPFSAYMNFGDLQLASCSPERFLKTDGQHVETKPIKGTLPSSCPAAVLINSKKDIAENTMIVDLLRNDLSKVCDFHSVKVPTLCALETFEGLHHLVSTVTGTLQKGKNAIDLLKACFPGGSITGAPKIRAMKIIEEFEPTRRGPYCGAMGYIGFDGNMDTNIIIRTLIYANDKVYLQTGSGIISDSMPEKELQESLDKAAKIFESFENNKKENAA